MDEITLTEEKSQAVRKQLRDYLFGNFEGKFFSQKKGNKEILVAVNSNIDYSRIESRTRLITYLNIETGKEDGVIRFKANNIVDLYVFFVALET